MQNSLQMVENKPLDPIESLFNSAPIFQFKRKQVLFHEGHPALGIYYLKSGHAKIYRMGANGRPYILFLACAGDILNAECAFGGGEFTTSAEMLVDGDVAFIEREKFNGMLGQSISLSLFIAELMAHRLSVHEEERVRLAEGTVRERMAGILIKLGRRYGKAGIEGLSISLQLSREELASMIGSTPGTVMRLLKDFKDEAAIRLSGKRIVLEKIEYLEKVAQFC